MSQATVSFSMDEVLLRNLEAVLKDMGTNIEAAFTDFAKRIIVEKSADFESRDPFYSESNVKYLKKIMQDVKENKAHFAEHQLLEVN